MDPITITLGYCTATVRGVLPKPPASGVLLCIGNAMSEAEIKAAQDFAAANSCEVAACNESVTLWPGGLAYAVSTHSSQIMGWVDKRKVKKSKPTVVSSKPVPGVDISIAADRAVGGSAMLMVMLGKAAGYERIVLVGVDLSAPGYDRFQPLWVAARAQGLLEGVESLTPGWVAQLLAGRVK